MNQRGGCGPILLFLFLLSQGHGVLLAAGVLYDIGPSTFSRADIYILTASKIRDLVRTLPVVFLCSNPFLFDALTAHPFNLEKPAFDPS